MRARDFMFEEDTSSSSQNLVATISGLRSKTDQIRVDSLVNMVRKQPGSEMFNVDLLLTSIKENPTIQNLVEKIATDDSGVKYVYFKQLSSDEDDDVDTNVPDVTPGGTADPEKTVSTMAKRATARRV